MWLPCLRRNPLHATFMLRLPEMILGILKDEQQADACISNVHRCLSCAANSCIGLPCSAELRICSVAKHMTATIERIPISQFMITSSTPIFDRPATLRSLSSDVVAEAGRTKALTVTLGFMARAAAMRCPREPAAPATNTVVCGSVLDMLTEAAQLMRITRCSAKTHTAISAEAGLAKLPETLAAAALKVQPALWGRTAVG